MLNQSTRPAFYTALEHFFFEEKPFHRVKIIGNSMAPMLSEGVEIIIKPCTRLLSGRCYAFFQGQELIIHRLVAKKADTLYFCGDNALVGEWVDRACVVGELDQTQDSGYITTILLLIISRLLMPILFIRLFGRLRIALIRKIIGRV